MIGRHESHDAESFDRAWTSRATHRRRALSGDSADLIRTAELLCRSASIEPSEQFRSDLRARLMAEATDVLVKTPRAATPATPSRPTAPSGSSTVRRRRLAGLAAALVASTATVGLVSSSASAVPGDVLYPVKRGVESVQLAVQRDDAGRGQTQLDQASERLTEAWSLDSSGRDDRVADALDAFSTQATAGSDALFETFAGSGEDRQMDVLNSFAGDSSAVLVQMSDDLPDEAQDALASATTLVLGIADRAGTQCPSCEAPDLGALLQDEQEALLSASASGRDAAPSTPAPTPASAPARAPVAEPSAPRAAAPTTKAPAPAPAPAASSPTPTVRTPALRDVTDPVIGGLLGSEDQPGLVPSLLDGLLGGGTK